MKCCTEKDTPEEETFCYQLKQQTLPSFTPIYTPQYFISGLVLFAVICIPIGAAVLAKNQQIGQIEKIRYDERCPIDTTCEISFELKENIRSPSYLYYGIDNMYQNARRYVKSVSYNQLRGIWPTTDLQSCDPIIYNADDKSEGNPEGIIIPCGLQAWSYFNDTITFCRTDTCQGNTEVVVTNNGIAWPSDIGVRYSPGPVPPWTASDNKLIMDEAFMVWMRVATFPNFLKLYKIVEEDLEPGIYSFRIQSNYPVASFNGRKNLFITETSWFGPRNQAIGLIYVITGSLLILLALIFGLRHKLKPRSFAWENPEQLRLMLEKVSRTKARAEQLNALGDATTNEL